MLCFTEAAPRTINVLLIGESGVGKSTWINAFGNYCKYDCLEDAAYDGGFFPIPSTFTVEHPQTGKQISISSDGELLSLMQSTEPGESVTQNPKEYVFRHNDTIINLIDTPGLLHTHDVDHPVMTNLSNMSTTFSNYFQHIRKFTPFLL